MTNIYSIEYDGFADFPSYPLNFLSDLNAFLGIESLHGTYLNGGDGTGGLGSGPSLGDIDNATPLDGSGADTATNYYMITTLDGTDAAAGHEIMAPLVALLPTQLQELLGPDLTYLINLGYGDGSLGYSDGRHRPTSTPRSGCPPTSACPTVLNTLATDTEQGIQNLMTRHRSVRGGASTSTRPHRPELPGSAVGLEADAADPAATFTEFVNALSSAPRRQLYSTLLPTADIINSLVTSMPARGKLSIFSADTLPTGDFCSTRFGLPVAADT